MQSLHTNEGKITSVGRLTCEDEELSRSQHIFVCKTLNTFQAARQCLTDTEGVPVFGAILKYLAFCRRIKL